MMNRRTLSRAARAALLPLAAIVSLTACVDTVTIEDLPAHVAFVGPTLLVEDGVVETWFGIEDAEGGSVAVDFAVCPDSGGTCLDVPALGGSATLDRVPVAAQGATRPLRVVWQAPCAQASASLSATVAVIGSDVEGVTSAPFSLAELGACP